MMQTAARTVANLCGVRWPDRRKSRTVVGSTASTLTRADTLVLNTGIRSAQPTELPVVLPVPPPIGIDAGAEQLVGVPSACPEHPHYTLAGTRALPPLCCPPQACSYLLHLTRTR